MADFPLFVKMEGRSVIVIGAGHVALRKVRMLVSYGAAVTVIAPDMCEALREMAEVGQIRWQAENLTEMHIAQLSEAFLVICATNDRKLNAQTAEFCKRHQILVDCADPGDQSDCIFPAIVRRGNVVIGISTSGGVPALTKHLREKIELAVPEWYAQLEETLRMKRLQFRQSHMTQKEKKRQLQQWIQDEEKKREGR